MAELTQEQLDEIQARCEAATSAPWEQHRPSGEYVHNPETNFNVCMTRRSYDADFIAHARTDIPALLAEVERLREENRWIPVSERLPDYNVPVLIYANKRIYTATLWKVDHIEWWSVNNCGNTDKKPETKIEAVKAVAITHWRPLPQAPEGVAK